MSTEGQTSISKRSDGAAPGGLGAAPVGPRRAGLRAVLCAVGCGALGALGAAQDTITVFRGARIHSAAAAPVDNGILVIAGGRIVAVGGPNLELPAGATVVDCAGRVMTPGLVDAGTTLGVQPGDLNEQGEEITPQLRVVDALDPKDVRLRRALRGGVTTIQVNPGNRNVVGGLGAVIKTVGDTVAAMLVRDESGLRLTMGSEPSSGNRAIRGGTPVGIYYRRPTTRMGVVWETRKAFYDAKAYQERKTVPDADGGEAAVEPGMEVLVRALQGEVTVRTTARMEQDIRTALRLADEFGYKALVEEATEAWRVIDDLAAAGVPVLVASPSRLAAAEGAEVRLDTLNLLAARDIPFAICTGADDGGLGLAHEAMFAVRNGLSPERALRAVTLDAARMLGIDERVGSLQAGRDADFVLWSGDPFDPTSAVLSVYVGGREVL
jgi:imidazolonepropionase-like amidohydrolase